jgi:hypothetical protein
VSKLPQQGGPGGCNTLPRVTAIVSAAGALMVLVALRDVFDHRLSPPPRDPRHALPVVLPGLLEVVERCSAPDRPAAVRFQAAMLDQALEDLLSTIAEDFVGAPARDPHEALAGYRGDHLWASG